LAPSRLGIASGIMPSVVLHAGLFAGIAWAAAALDDLSGSPLGCSRVSVSSPRSYNGKHTAWLFGKVGHDCSGTCGDYPCIEQELQEIDSKRAFKRMLKLVVGQVPECRCFKEARDHSGSDDLNKFAPYMKGKGKGFGKGKGKGTCYYVSGKGGRATPRCDAKAEYAPVPLEDEHGVQGGKGKYRRFCPCKVPCQRSCRYCKGLCEGFNLTLGGGYLQCKRRCMANFAELQVGLLDDYCDRGVCRRRGEIDVAGQPGDPEEQGEETHLLQYHRSIQHIADGPGNDLDADSEIEGKRGNACRPFKKYCRMLCRFELTDASARDCRRTCKHNRKSFKAVFNSYCSYGACGGTKYDKEKLEDDEGEAMPLLQSPDDEQNDGGEDEDEDEDEGEEVTSLLQNAVHTSSRGLEL